MPKILTKGKPVKKPGERPGDEQGGKGDRSRTAGNQVAPGVVKILMIENNPVDVEFTQNELKKGGMSYISEVVQNENDYRLAISNFVPDIILSDFALPKFDGDTAFKIRNQLIPDTPFIFISGTIGEEKSVGYMKDGLTDYVLKDKLYTLAIKVRRALDDVAERREKRKVEDELIRSEMRFRALIEKSTEMKTLSSPDGKFLYASPSVTTTLGYTIDEFLHKSIVDLVHDDDMPAFLNKREGIIHAPGNSVFNEVRLRHKNGSWIWCEGFTTNMLHEPAINAMVSNFIDISDRKLILERIAESERFIKTITDSLPAMISYWDAGLHCLFANQPYMDWFEKPSSEILGISMSELWGKREFDLQENHIRQVLEGEAQRFEHTFHRADGKAIDSDTQYLPDKQGDSVKGFYSLIYDVTEVKMAELASIQALEERNTILESIDDAFFAVDKDWVVTYWNNTAEEVLGTPKAAIINKNLWEVFATAVGSQSYKCYHEAIQTQRAVHFEDFYPPLNKWYEISAYPSAAGLSVYFKDITERKAAEARMKELNENLTRRTKDLAVSNAELEQFAYVASHDLQEPLRMVTSFLTQLERKYGDIIDDKGRQYIHFAVDGAKRMRQIILDLLDFSRVGRTDDDLETLNFNKLVDELLALYRRQIDELQAVVVSEKLPTLQTYKTPVRQVFQNLISNSLKYHKPGSAPVIKISSVETKTNFQFSVTDNGIGIAPEYFDKIFVIFQRLHNKDEYSGTGMGLAIAKKIIENLGGKIWIESAEGEGSTFYFTLPKSSRT
ncbi:PAS domain S-box protein [Mucilaginibacter ginsenosidivorans]|uniref:histidine kinase n=1 Tax=Mucilaginibacter ginsenosidivorans TaxID=398053 RepID=A0A5B8UY63_9SPHI|nr:PAS domain S-box protein [Mucilaginibacter ginsenosidivorans]QEC64014.1 PAS domain S-box protein [Mucilaginibacter ginsenosidivorans]